jgi:hypothetical protein
MSLVILSNVIAAGSRSWANYAAVVLAAIALPTLVMYLILESNRELLRTGALRGLLAIGQTLSSLALIAFIASYSEIAAGVMIGTFVFTCAWAVRRLPRWVARRWSQGSVPEPRFHRTKMDRLLWAIVAAARELDLKDHEISIGVNLRPTDFDGHELHNVSFRSPETATRFQTVLRRKLGDAAGIAAD